jgi:hypothetical protein
VGLRPQAIVKLKVHESTGVGVSSAKGLVQLGAPDLARAIGPDDLGGLPVLLMEQSHLATKVHQRVVELRQRRQFEVIATIGKRLSPIIRLPRVMPARLARSLSHSVPTAAT